MAITLNGTTGISSPGGDTSTSLATTNLSYTGTLTGGTGVIAIGTNQIYKDASGNVGIGTSSPTSKLSFGANIGLDFAVYEGAAGANKYGIGMSGAGTSPDPYRTKLYANGSEVVSITSVYNVGIGTSSPSYKLHVATGSLTLNGADNSVVTLRSGTSTYLNILQSYTSTFFGTKIVSTDALSFGTSSTDRLFIDISGALTVPNIYSNTTAAVTYVAVSSAGLLQRGGVSALKYKQDIRDLESIDITKFRPVRYKSKCENDDQTIDYFGFIADEVEEAGIKELITYNDDGEPEGFQYERMTVVLLKAIQELTTRLAKLEAQ